MNEYQWCVITKVPSEDEDGNLACFPFHLDRGLYEEGFGMKDMKDRKGQVLIGIYEVFQLGEILLVSNDHYVREKVGHGRTPRKWEVSYECFPLEDYQKAIDLALKVTSQVA